MKTKILFLLATLLAIASGAWAQSTYITDVMVIGCDDGDDISTVRTNYLNAGWSINWQELHSVPGTTCLIHGETACYFPNSS